MAMKAVASRITEVELRGHTMLPHAYDAGYVATGRTVCPSERWCHFGLIPCDYVPICSFGNKIAYPVAVYLERLQLGFCGLYKGPQLSLLDFRLGL